MSLRRVDPRFVLPRPPRTAVVFDGLNGWSEGLREAGIRQVAVSLQLVEDLLHFRANGTARDQPFGQFSARVFASREQTNRRRLERRLHLDGKLDR